MTFKLELMIIRLLMSLMIMIKNFVTYLSSITDNLKYIHLYLLVSFLADKLFLDSAPVLFLTKIVEHKSQLFLRISSAL